MNDNHRTEFPRGPEPPALKLVRSSAAWRDLLIGKVVPMKQRSWRALNFEAARQQLLREIFGG